MLFHNNLNVPISGECLRFRLVTANKNPPSTKKSCTIYVFTAIATENSGFSNCISISATFFSGILIKGIDECDSNMKIVTIVLMPSK